MFKKINPNNDKPTFYITWSDKICGRPCFDLINRYNLAAKSKKINLVIINIDQVGKKSYDFKSQQELEEVVKKISPKWSYAMAYYGFNKSGTSNFNNEFQTRASPLILGFDKNNMLKFARADYNYYQRIISLLVLKKMPVI